MKNPYATCMWYPGQTEEHVYGFTTKEARDAYQRGEPGPFERRLRPLDAPPIDDEVRLTRALLRGDVAAEIEHIKAREAHEETAH